jgi:hypothetical protein
VVQIEGVLKEGMVPKCFNMIGITLSLRQQPADGTPSLMTGQNVVAFLPNPMRHLVPLL